MFYFIFLLALIALVALLRTRVALYLLLILLPTYLIRTQISFVPTTFLEVAIYVVFGIWFLRALGEKSLLSKIKRLYRLVRPFLIPIILFFGAAILAVVFSPDKRLSLGVLKGWFFDPLLVLVLLLDLVRTKKQIKTVFISLFLSAAWVSVYGLYEWIGGVGLDSDGRLNSVYIPANYVALFITPLLVLGLLFFRKIKSKQTAVIYYFLLAATILALYLSKSYGGWLALFGTLIFLWPQVKIPRKRLKYLLIFALLVIIISVLQSQSVKFGHLFEFGYRTSSATRSEIWRTAALIIREHPFLGVGLGNFEAVYRENIPRIAFPPLEWLVVKPHNLYLNLWIEMGLIGLISFIYLIVLFFRQGIRTLDSAVGKYLLAAMIALLVHGLVDTPYFKNDLSVLFWVLVGLLLIITQSRNKKWAKTH